MRKVKEVLRLRFELGLSQRQIARSCGMGLSTVHEYLERAARAGISWPLEEGLGEVDLEAKLFGNQVAVAPKVRGRPEPDWKAMHEQLQQHRHLTLQLLWQEYRQAHPEGYRYSWFCERYQQWRRHLDVVLRQEHKAGEKMFVDWAGATIPVYDATTGEPWQASLFVAVLGASSYTYAQATHDQQLETWIQAHIQALEFFGGAPTLAVPDNTRTAVTRSCRYDPDLNPTYQEFAVHYGMGVVPARPYKPRDKACVSYCTSFLLCNGESWLLRSASSMAFHDSVFVQRFVETALGVAIAMLFQATFSCPKIDCRGRYTVAHTHLLGRKQPHGSQAAVATSQTERLPNMRNFLWVERSPLPSPFSLLIQDFCDFPITMVI